MKHNGELVPEYNSPEPHPGSTGQGRTEDRAPPTKGLPKDPAPQPAEQPAPERNASRVSVGVRSTSMKGIIRT